MISIERPGPTTAAAPRRLVERVAETRLPTRHGEFTAYGYRITIDGSEHVALVYGDLASTGDGEPVLTRVHSECLTGDVFGSRALRLRAPARRGAASGSSTRAGGWWSTCAGTRAAGSGCWPSCRPTSSRTAAATPSTPTSTSGCPPTPATTAPPRRSCATSASTRVRLLTNNPDKAESLEDFGIPVAERVPLTPRPNDHNLRLPAHQARPDGPRAPRAERRHGTHRGRGRLR